MGPEPVECSIRAFGIVQARPATIAALRKKPAPADDSPVFASALKYADDQTVVSLAAVLQAIHDGGLDKEVFTNWGVVAGPCFLGRQTLVTSFKRFQRQGALGVSPLLIPYLSQHAVAGTISLPLGIHGPNLGVGGDRGSLTQALLAGLALQWEQGLPGVWVVASEWNPEPVTIDKSAASEDAVCHGVALALLPARGQQNLRVRVTLSASGPAGPRQSPVSITSLIHFLTQQPLSPSWLCPLAWNASLEVTREPQVLARAA
jgi:hypothetical protein